MTIEALDRVFETFDDEPQVIVRDDEVTVSIAASGGVILFTLAHISYRRGSMEAETTVRPRLPGMASDDFTAHLVTTSLSSRDAYRRALQNAFEGAGVNWTSLINTACKLARASYLAAPHSVDLASIDISVREPYCIANFMPKAGVTVLFGMGESLKGQAATSIALHVSTGLPWLGHRVDPTNVLILDYEDCDTEAAGRRNRHALALPSYAPSPGTISYMSGGGIGVADQLDTIKRELRQTNSGLLIVDSALFALADDPVKAEPVGRLFNAFNALGRSVLLIAHTDKAESDKMPYGSVFWHNAPRATWYVKAGDTDIGAAERHVGFYCRKMNNAPRPRPFGAVFTFDDEADRTGPIAVSPFDLRDDDEQASRLSLVDRISGAIRRGPLTFNALAETLDAKRDTIEKAVRRRSDMFVMVDSDKGRAVSLLETRRESD